jgi:Subtilase family
MAHMRRVRTMACVLVAITLMVSLLNGSAFAATADKRRKIVMFPGTPDQSVVDQLEGAGIMVLDKLSVINALAVQLPLPTVLGIDPALALLQNLTNLGVVQQVVDDVLTFIDPICPTGTPPSAQEYRWGMQQIGVPAAHQQWPQPNQTAAVTVAVLDTGIASHLELSARTVQGYNAFTGTDQTPDGHGHGTAMAGIILAKKDGEGVVGVAGVEPKITVAPVKVLDDTGAGYLSKVIKGLEWVLQNDDISVVNMSFGFSFSNQNDGKPLKDAIQSLSNAGIVMVASAGNRCQKDGGGDDGGGDDNCGPAATCDAPLTAIMAPANLQEKVIGVGAINKDGEIADYSLSGSQLVWAPGGEPASGAPE